MRIILHLRIRALQLALRCPPTISTAYSTGSNLAPGAVNFSKMLVSTTVAPAV
jgi:hypothetical protein